MSDQIKNRSLSILKDMPNVIVTPHMAFYTREAVEQMPVQPRSLPVL